MNYLENAEKYAEQVRKGFAEELIIYEGEQDTNLDLAASCSYHEAVDICGCWLRELLLRELALHPEYSSVSCMLRLPCTNLDVSIEVNANEKSARGTCVPQILDTPIGCIDDFIFSALRTCDNPITVLYRQLGVLSHHLHNLLAMRGQEQPLITQDILMENGINDPICVHMMETLLLDVDDFFDRKA